MQNITKSTKTAEVITLQLGQRQYLGGKDEIGRTHIGYEPDMTKEQIYEAGQGLWNMNLNRAFNAERILICENNGYILLDLDLTGVRKVKVNDSKNEYKVCIYGEFNKSSRYEGRVAPVNQSRNRVSYFSQQYIDENI